MFECSDHCTTMSLWCPDWKFKGKSLRTAKWTHFDTYCQDRTTERSASCLFSSVSVSLIWGDACLSQVKKLDSPVRVFRRHIIRALKPDPGCHVFRGVPFFLGISPKQRGMRSSRVTIPILRIQSQHCLWRCEFGEVIRSLKEYTQWKEGNGWLWKAIKEARERAFCGQAANNQGSWVWCVWESWTTSLPRSRNELPALPSFRL